MAYIAFPVEAGGEVRQGEWYEINLAGGNANPLKRLGEIPLPPAQVAAAVLIHFNEIFQEYMISSTGKGPLYMNDYSSGLSASTDRFEDRFREYVVLANKQQHGQAAGRS